MIRRIVRDTSITIKIGIAIPLSKCFLSFYIRSQNKVDAVNSQCLRPVIKILNPFINL